MTSVSLKFRREEGPLLRVKAPVRLAVFPLAVGATYAVADGTALRVGSTLPWGLSWRLQFWPWGAQPLSRPSPHPAAAHPLPLSASGPQPASLMVKYPLHVLGGGLHLGAEVELSTGASRLMLRAKPRLGAFSLGQQPASSQPGGGKPGAGAKAGSAVGERSECTLHVHSSIPLGTCQWAQLRWEVSAPADALLSGGWPGGGGLGAGRGSLSLGGGLHRSSSSALDLLATLPPSWPDRAARPWLQVRLGKVSFLRMPDRAAARQGLCAACMRAPIVREQTPAVRGGLSPQGLAAAYAGMRLSDAAPVLRGLRRDQVTDLKAVTLALWLRNSGGGQSRLASHHCNYSRMGWKEELAGVATPVRYKGPDGRGVYASFDSAADFITGFWRVLGRHPTLAAGAGEAPPAPKGRGAAAVAAMAALMSGKAESVSVPALSGGSSEAGVVLGGEGVTPTEDALSASLASASRPTLSSSLSSAPPTFLQRLDGAQGSDAACSAFLDALQAAGAVAGEEGRAEVEGLLPEARRLLAQGRGL